MPELRQPHAKEAYQTELKLPGTDALRILIVDDHSIVRDGLRQILAEKFPRVVIGEARNAREALDQASRAPWTIVLLDISMPGQSGLEVLKQLKTLRPEASVLVLTMHPEEQYAVRALKAGAAGYLTKESAAAELVKAVHQVLAGGKYISGALAQILVTGLGATATPAPYDCLSDREYQVLRMIAGGKSVKEISFELSLSIKTVSTYRTRVLKKLGLKSNAEAIRYAIREHLVD